MDIDYGSVGLKCGLEIHQQLNTNKLFCNCPSLLVQEIPDFIIKRKLHAVAGESGEIDVAAGYESSLNKTYKYQVPDTVCLVELDESPPFNLNQEALEIATQIATLLNCKILPISQIMRKTVIDGSNTSGFQRTVLIAVDGFIQTSQGRVGIDTICLEEDSARIVSREGNSVTYRLDRLGVPLIEIATSPDIISPAQAKETAMNLGNILRSFNVKRGIGTIRQDVNVSVKNGKRVEIKGVQDPELIEKSVEMEVKRQLDLIKIKKKFNSEVRKVLPDGKTVFLRPMPGASRMYPETDLPLLRIGRDFINKAKNNLPKLRKETEKELEETGLHEEMIKLLFKKNKLEEFKELLKIMNNPKLIAKILLIYPNEISTKKKISVGESEEVLNRDVLEFILENVKNGNIKEQKVKQVMEEIIDGKKLDEIKFHEEHSHDIIEEKVLKIIKSKPGLSIKAYMGLVMNDPDLKGKITGKEVMEIFKKHI